MDRELRNAKQAGSASYITSRRLGSALDGVVRKLNAQFEADYHEFEEGPNAPSPSEMAVLRDRYLEHKAVDEHSQSLLRQYREHPRFELVVTFVRMVYRLTLFAAAIVILHRAIVDWILH
jgi:hypothetical protein